MNSLSERLEEHLLKNANSAWRKGFRPSQISYKFCPRQYALLALGYLEGESIFSPQTLRIFENGHKFHDRMQAWVKEMGLVFNHPKFVQRDGTKGIGEEVRIKHPIGLSSALDNVLKLEDGYLDVVDYKSIKSDSFLALLEPQPYHRKQIIMYLGLLEWLIGSEITQQLRGRLLYENKDTQQFKEFIIPWDDDAKRAWLSLLKLLKSINEAVEAKDPLLVPCSCGKCENYDLLKLAKSPKKVAM